MLAKALAGTNEEEGAKHAFSISIAQLRAYLRERSSKLVHEVDSFIQEAPCTSYSRICYMDMLAGEPLAWGKRIQAPPHGPLPKTGKCGESG
jgi:hypothetical protein